MINNVDRPWDLPSYRFGALIVFFMKYEKTEESVKMIDQSLIESDNLPQPFLSPTFLTIVKFMGGILGTPVTKTVVDNVIYDSRLVKELPIEERKKREAQAKGKAFRVPEWWRGEQANYKVAKSMMKTLPKKVGKPIDQE